MALNNATPTLWAKEILRAYNTLTVFNSPGVMSRAYEGDIKNAGDSVKIVSIGDPEIRKYTKNTDITGPDTIVDASQTLVIDQADYLNWAVDGIDLVQVTVDVMQEASRRSAYKLRKEADSFTSKFSTSIDSATKTTEVKRSTFTEGRSAVYDAIVEAGVKLDETDTPEEGRFIVINPASVGALQKDIRFTGFGTGPNRATLEQGLGQGVTDAPFGNGNGFVGKAAGFNVFQSNQIQVTTKKYSCIAGHPTAWTFADQILNFETYRPEKRIGASGVKALHVYGGKVLRPSSLSLVTIEDA